MGTMVDLVGYPDHAGGQLGSDEEPIAVALLDRARLDRARRGPVVGVCRRSGIKPPSLYARVDGTAGLFAAVYDRRMTEVRAIEHFLFDQLPRADTSLAEQATAAADAIAEVFATHARFLRPVISAPSTTQSSWSAAQPGRDACWRGSRTRSPSTLPSATRSRGPSTRSASSGRSTEQRSSPAKRNWSRVPRTPQPDRRRESGRSRPRVTPSKVRRHRSRSRSGTTSTPAPGAPPIPESSPRG